jgi:hypothetical protein
MRPIGQSGATAVSQPRVAPSRTIAVSRVCIASPRMTSFIAASSGAAGALAPFGSRP